MDLVKNFKVSALDKGWFMVIFENKEAADWVVERNWAFGNYPVLFKQWSPMFDALHERTDVFLVWVRALGLPSFLWVESVFMSIGNLLGTYLEADMSFIQTQNKAMARILVDLKPRGGLAETIKIQYKDYVFEQPLDYEHLPFKCHRCHVYGHLARDFPLGKRRRRHQKTIEEEGKEADQNQPFQNVETEENQEVEAMDVDKNQEGKKIYQASNISSGMKGMIRTAPGNEILIQEPIKGPSASTNANPIEDLMGMRLDSSNPSLSPSEIKYDCLITGSHRKNFMLVDQTHVENLTAAIPSLYLNHEDDLNEEVNLNFATPACHYNLQYLDKRPVILGLIGGIGLTSPQSLKRKVRGRKSNLSKSQVRAKFDVVDGKQMSIHGALGAVHPQENVIK